MGRNLNMKDYEKKVMDHYNKVAKDEGDSELSTMKDRYIRHKETGAILSAIETFVKETGREDLSIIDVGCGNGFTLSEIKKRFEKANVEGLEKNDSLRELAQKREGLGSSIYAGDITNPFVSMVGQKDVVITQRVVINLHIAAYVGRFCGAKRPRCVASGHSF